VGETSEKNVAGAWSRSEEWRLVEESRIGRPESDGPESFGNITAADIDQLGRVWVADAQQHQIRIFSPQGHHVRSIGRQGGGPAEFRRISGMAWAPDGLLWVLDDGNARFAVYDTTGRLVTTHPRSSLMATLPWPGRFDSRGRFYDVDGTLAPDGSIITWIIRTDAAGQPRDTFRLPRFEEERFQITRGDARNQHVTQVTVPFTGRQVWTLDPQGRVWIANTAKYRIERHTFDGVVDAVVEREHPRVPVTRDERAGMLKAYPEFTRQGGKIDISRIPDVHPVHGGFLFDDAGRLWVMPVTGRREQRVLDVFEPDGRYLGRVALPAPHRSTLKAIRGNRMVVVIRDDDDVQSLAVIRIEKPGPDR
jgi:sugar lactone lactonase YvrE